MTTNGTVTTTPRRDRFASGAAVKLPLSDGDWVLVRAELTFGQERRLAGSGLSGVPAVLADQGQGQQLSFDLAAFEVERLVTWLLDWSFTDGDGDHIVLTRERILALTPETAAEIGAALDRHVGANEAKKGRPAPARFTWAERTESDLVLCRTFGWTWDELMHTPADVVGAAVALVNRWASGADGPTGADAQGAQEWPGA